MLTKILPFEIRYRFANPLTWLILLMMVFQGVWYSLGTYDFYVHDQTWMNAAGVFYICLTGGGIILMIIIAMITGTTLYRDIEQRTAQSLYSLPVDEKQFFLGRFLGAYVINLLLIVAYVLGMVIMQYLGIWPADKFGPVPWRQLLHGYVLFGVPNIFVLTSISYFCLVFFRNVAASYIGIFVLVLIFAVCEGLSHNSPYINAIMIADPFGFVYTKEVVDAMAVTEKNSAFLPVDAVFLANRLLWTGLGLVAVVLSYFRFSFKFFINSALGGKGKRMLFPGQASHPGSFRHIEVPEAQKTFTLPEYFRKVWRLSLLEFRNVVRPVSFKVILMVIAIMFFLYMILWNPVYYIGSQVPLTSGMTLTRLHTGFLVIILLMIWSGELFFKDRTIGIWQITDSVPMPSWVSLLSRFVAMCGVALMISFTIFLCGLAAQVGQGFFAIDWMLYVDDLLGFKMGWMTYVLFIACVFLLAGLTGNRYLTHVLGVGYFIFIIISFELNLFEQSRFGYAQVPGIDDFSEMNRYGVWATSSFWHFLMWLPLAASFLLIGIQLWSRGTEKGFLKRLLSPYKELGWSGALVAVVCFALFLSLQSFLVAEVNGTRNYVSSEQEDREAAEYEKRYRGIQASAQPGITAVDLQLDLFPLEQAAEYRATLELVNPSGEKISTLYINADYFTEIRTIQIDGRALEKQEEDKVLGMEVYRLPEAMAPGDVLPLFIEARTAYRGLAQGDPRADLAYNGLFMERPVPVIGYDSDRELLENKERKVHGLEMIDSRMAPVDDTAALGENYFSQDASLVQGRITVSTPLQQTAFAPGKQVKNWQENGRSYFVYELEKRSPLLWYVGSANYAEQKSEIAGTEVSLLYAAGDDYNLDHYRQAVEDGLLYLEEYLGAYPYRQLRVAEIPFYQDPSYAFANTIVISEKEGWYGDRSKEDVVSFIQFSVARELFRQWVFENGFLPNVQGVEMLWKALPEALSLQLVEKKYGQEQVDIILEKKRRKYKKDRGGEPNQEPPLLYADGIDYLEENKGALALYHLSKSIGHEELLRHVKDWFRMQSGKPLVFRDFYNYLKEQTVLEERIRKMFETVEAKVNV